MFKFYYYLTYPLTVLCLFFLEIYKKILTHAKHKCCRFMPTCSEYAYLSIKEFGCVVGGILAFKRLLRCRPNKPAGVDYPKLNLLGNYKWKC